MELWRGKTRADTPNHDGERVNSQLLHDPHFLWGISTFVLAIAATFGVAIKSAYDRRPKETPNVFGDARFMNESEVKRSGLLATRQPSGADGVYLGAWRDNRGTLQYLRDTSNTHVSICGPTRTGKSISCILPTLLSWRGSAIVNDEKGELWLQTAAWRERHLGRVIRWEPGATSGTASWNPLAEIRITTPYEVSDAQNVALMLIDVRGHGLDRLDHWQKATVPLLAALILHELYETRAFEKRRLDKEQLEELVPWVHLDDRRPPSRERIACLGDIALRFADPTSTDISLFEEMRDNLHDRDRTHFMIAAEGIGQINRSDRERSSVNSTLRTFLTLFYDPIVSANTEYSDLRLAEIADGHRPLTVYLTTLPNDTVRLRPLLRLFLTMAIRSLMHPNLRYVRGQPISPHRHQTLFCLDEFPSLGKLEEVETDLARCAAWGVKFLLAIQDLTQLDGIYGRGHSILANTQTRAYFPTGDVTTARVLSESTGTMTANTPHTTIMGRRFGFMGQVTKSIQPTAKPLLTPGQILAMRAATKDDDGRITEPGETLIFLTGHRPLLAQQMLYFTDPEFAARAQIAAA